MPDRGQDLERELQELGYRVEYPRTPDLAGSTRRRIEEEAEARTHRRGLFWLPALPPRWAVAAMFVLVLAVPALSPTVRDELSGLFAAEGGAGYGGDAARPAAEDQAMSGKTGPRAAAESAAGVQAAPESAANAGTAGGGQSESMQGGGTAGADEGYASRITLREARSRAGDAPVLLPRALDLGKPDAVYGVRAPYGKGLAFVYNARPGLPAFGGARLGMVLTETPGDLQGTYLRSTPNQGPFEKIVVGSRRGYWNPRSPAYWVPGPDRAPAPGPAGSVLLWQRDGRALRLESNLGKNAAIGVAESVR